MRTLSKGCLHGGEGPQIGEVTCDKSPHLSCKRDQINETLYGQEGYPTLADYLTFLGSPTSM